MTATGGVGLTAEQRARFERDGFLIYGPLWTADELETLRTWIDALASGSTPEAQRVGRRLEEEARQGGLQDVDERDRVWQLTGVTRQVPALLDHCRRQVHGVDLVHPGGEGPCHRARATSCVEHPARPVPQ